MLRQILLGLLLLVIDLPGLRLLQAAEIHASMFASEFGLTIIGTIISKNRADNVVLVKFKDTGIVKAMRVGFPVFDKYSVLEIENNFIIVSANGASPPRNTKLVRDGFVESAPASAAKPAVAAPFSDSFKEDGFERNKNTIEMTEGYRDKIIAQDLPKILMQASAEPVLQNGQIMGFMIDQIEAGSIYAKAGLKDGDVITSINDISLQDVTATIKLLHSLKNSKDISLELTRGGQSIPVQVKVK